MPEGMRNLEHGPHSPGLEPRIQDHDPVSDVIMRWFYAYNTRIIDSPEMPSSMLRWINHHLVAGRCEFCMDRFMRAKDLPLVTLNEIISGVSRYPLS